VRARNRKNDPTESFDKKRHETVTEMWIEVMDGSEIMDFE